MVLLGDYNKLFSVLSNRVFDAVHYTPACERITRNCLLDAQGARLEVHDSVFICEFSEGRVHCDGPHTQALLPPPRHQAQVSGGVDALRAVRQTSSRHL